MFPSSTESVRAPFITQTAAGRSGVPALEREIVELYAEYRTSLLRYALSFGLSIEDSEEAVQEVFLALFQHLRLGKPRANLRGWLFRVGHNIALKQRYRIDRRGRASIDEPASAEPLDTAPNPEEQAVSAERQRRLLKTYHDLPERDRCCLNLRAEGLRYREIARVLGISLGAVALSLGRSIRRLGAV